MIVCFLSVRFLNGLPSCINQCKMRLCCGSPTRQQGNKAKEGKCPWAPDMISCTPPLYLHPATLQSSQAILWGTFRPGLCIPDQTRDGKHALPHLNVLRTFCERQSVIRSRFHEYGRDAKRVVQAEYLSISSDQFSIAVQGMTWIVSLW